MYAMSFQVPICGHGTLINADPKLQALSCSTHSAEVLRAQLSGWQKFRAFQRRIRAYYRNKSFSVFVDKVRERRRRHKVDGDVRLLFTLEQQAPSAVHVRSSGFANFCRFTPALDTS